MGNADAVSKGQKLSPLAWTTTMETALLEGLCEQVRLGKRADSAFKKEAWQAVLPYIQAHVSQTDDQGNLRVVSQAQASNKTSDFKALFVEWRALKEASGVGWDEETGLPVASDDWWSHYLKVS